LIRINAYASFAGRTITTELVDEVLKDVLPAPRNKQITIEDIQVAVAQHFSLRTEDMKAKKRTKAIAFPRQIAMYLSRKLTEHSLPKIGDEFGGRDHTTVLHACDKIENDISTNPQLAETIKALTENLKQH
jgi:chromosomal replication initiator protein